jgi:hypothetical protein
MRSRLWKTALRFGAPELYLALLTGDIVAHTRRARRMGLKPAIRLDGSSDLGDAKRIAPFHPYVQFYDYTKSPARAKAHAEGRLPENWHVVLSYSGMNEDECRGVLTFGGNVAVVFDRKPAHGERKAESLPKRWHGFPILDADKDDLRFLDPPGHVAGLRFKAAKDRARHLEMAGRFVVREKGRTENHLREER